MRADSRWCRLLPMVAVAALTGCSSPPTTQRLEGEPSLRGLSAWSPRLAWVSGSAGTVASSTDGGQTWEVVPGPPGLEEPLDYRDLEVLSPDEIVLMAAGPGEKSKIFRSENAGRSWRLVAQNHEPDGFWDGIDFWNRERGLLIGDPIDGRLTILSTTDGGRSWHAQPASAQPVAEEGEYAFAASGTSVTVAGTDKAWIATGGSVARVFLSEDGGAHWEAVSTPISAGTPGSGIFSIAFRDEHHGVVVGGDYERPDQVLVVAAWTEDGGRTWEPAEAMPGGYRSGVSWQESGRRWIAVGPNGIDVSTDGRHWTPMQPSLEGYHSVDGAWMSGAEGRAAHLP